MAKRPTLSLIPQPLPDKKTTMIMNHKILFFAVAAALLCSQATATDLICRVLLVDVDSDVSSPLSEDDKEIYRCETDRSEESDGMPFMVYGLDIPSDFVNQHSDELESSEAFVAISQGKALRGNETVAPHISYPVNATFSIVQPKHRQLSTIQLQGVSRLLVVRVTASDSSLTVSNDDIAGGTFGLGPKAQAVNVASQFDSCSFGKLKFVPVQGPGVVNGVGHLTVNQNYIGVNTANLENQLTALTQAKFGNLNENYEHVVYCLPPGTVYGYYDDPRWFAYAYIKSWRSYYNDDFCLSLSGVIHELGHNLNLRHSDAAIAYGDLTGYMGASTTSLGAPASCFNGNKNWHLGWFNDKTIDIDWEKPWGGYLFAFTDYDIMPDYGVVIIKVGPMYLQYNRAKSFNSGTRARRDSVTIVYSPRPTSQSILAGSVAFPQKAQSPTAVTFPNWERSDSGLVIQACQTINGPPDAIRMSIHLDGHQSTCHSNLFSNSPTSAPSPAPSSGIIEECEDDPRASFWADEEETTKMKCLQLSNSPAWRKKICHPGHAAWDLCPDSCQQCRDGCNDSLTHEFFVNKVQGYQDCDWLARRPGWQTHLCKPGLEPYEVCGETCNSCEPDSTPVPSPAPSTLTPTGFCEDEIDKMFLVDSVQRDCTWLSRNSQRQADLCLPGQPSREVCKELCGACTDFCLDDPDASIFINDVLGNQSCAWLSVRPGIAEKLCTPGGDIFYACGETCNSC